MSRTITKYSIPFNWCTCYRCSVCFRWNILQIV